MHGTAGAVCAHALAALIPLVGVLDAVGPITAIFLALSLSGSAWSFLSSTEPFSASSRAIAWCSGDVTTASGAAGSATSNRPAAMCARTIRNAASSTWAWVMRPAASACSSRSGVQKRQRLSSWSRPAASDGGVESSEWRAPKSVTTQPSKPISCLRIWCSVFAFSHA